MSSTPSGGAHRGRSDTASRTEPRPEPESRPSTTTATDLGTITHRQKERFGGIKWGSAFFGWLTAIGTAVLLSALVAGVGAAFDLALTKQTSNADTFQDVGVAGAIVVAVVLLVAYYCGGYVAGRMARFNGMKQGIAVWIWTIVITLLAGILIKVVGADVDVPNGLPRLPIDGDTLTWAGVVSALIALAICLVGAILGGLAGMRFHRKVDRAGVDAELDSRADDRADSRADDRAGTDEDDEDRTPGTR
jgi:hypothetical protein